MGKDQITVRYGLVAIHCSVNQLAAVLDLVEQKHRASRGRSQVGDELKEFPEAVREVVASTRDGDAGAPGVALASVRDVLGKPLANEVRSLLRARGASEHPVPAGKCKRVLESARRALRGGVCGRSSSCEESGGQADGYQSDASTVDPYLSFDEAVVRYGGGSGKPGSFDGGHGVGLQRCARPGLVVISACEKGQQHQQGTDVQAVGEQLQQARVDEPQQVLGEEQRDPGAGLLLGGDVQHVRGEPHEINVVVVSPVGAMHVAVGGHTTVNDLLVHQSGDAQAFFQGTSMNRLDKVLLYPIAEGDFIDVVVGS